MHAIRAAIAPRPFSCRRRSLRYEGCCEGRQARRARYPIHPCVEPLWYSDHAAGTCEGYA